VAASVADAADSAVVEAAVDSADSVVAADLEVVVQDAAGKGGSLEPKQVAKEFADELARALGPRLEGVMMYGSAARGEWLESASDINVLVLVDDINGESLHATSPVVRKYMSRRIHPIVLESKEWKQAADVFAIEISDMLDAHEQIVGENALSKIPVALPILRLQAERELRGKLLQIYLAMLVTETPDQLGNLLMGAMPSIVTYFRTALRLGRRDVPADSAEVLRQAGELTGADVSPLLRVLDARRGNGKHSVALNDPLVDACNTATEKLVQFIDNFGR
jgi:predicted nucleotidyltransferase